MPGKLSLSANLVRGKSFCRQISLSTPPTIFLLLKFLKLEDVRFLYLKGKETWPKANGDYENWITELIYFDMARGKSDHEKSPHLGHRNHGGSGGGCPSCPSVRGARIPFSFKMREYFKVNSCLQSIMTISNLTKFILRCWFDFGCFKIQQFLHEIARWPLSRDQMLPILKGVSVKKGVARYPT